MFKRRLLSVLTLILVGWFLLSQATQTPRYHVKSFIFGTMVDIHIVDKEETEARALADHVLADFRLLHDQWHAWKAQGNGQLSRLQQINQAIANQQAIQLETEEQQLFESLNQLSQASNGLFNPAIGQLINYWGFQSDQFDPIEIDPVKVSHLFAKRASLTDLQVTGTELRSNNPAVSLDLGGYAKGYALDRAIDYFARNGVKNALVNIGGNIKVLGKNDDQPWQVGIQHPRQANAMASLALPSGWAVGTSGDYQRYFMHDGQRYCHLIDPRTGYPVQHTQSVTVLIAPNHPLGTNGVLSDVLSKPLFIGKGAEKQALAKKLSLENFLIVDADGKIQVSKGMQSQLQWLIEGASIAVLD